MDCGLGFRVEGLGFWGSFPLPYLPDFFWLSQSVSLLESK